MLVHQGIDTFSAGMSLDGSEGLEVGGVGEWPRFFRGDEALLAEKWHLAIAVVVVEGDELGQVLDGRIRPETFEILIYPNRKIFEARKRETAALGAGEKLVLGHPLAATIGDSARCMQNLEKVLFTGPKTSDTVTFICD